MRKYFMLPIILLLFSCQEPKKDEAKIDNTNRFEMTVISKGENVRPDIFILDKTTGKTFVRDGNSSMWIGIGSPEDAVMQKY